MNGKQGHTTQAVAMALKEVKKAVPMCQLIVSYADCDQNHLGTIYQATNWIYVGKQVEGAKCGYLINGKKVHPKSIYSRIIVEDGVKKHCPQTLEYVRKYIDKDAQILHTAGKQKYLFPLDKRTRKLIEPLAQPYPKNEGWVKIDRRIFNEPKELGQPCSV